VQSPNIYDSGSNRCRSKWKIIQPCDRYVPLSRYRQSADSKIVVVPRIIQDPAIAVFLGILSYSVCLFSSYPPPFFTHSLSVASSYLFPRSIEQAIARVYSLFSLLAPSIHPIFHRRKDDSPLSADWKLINHMERDHIRWILSDFLVMELSMSVSYSRLIYLSRRISVDCGRILSQFRMHDAFP